MKEWMEKSEFDSAEKIAYFTAMYNELNVREACEKRIRELFDECDECIARLSVPEEKKAALKAFADALLNRNL
jgi:geranylgeranyl diphosphate synthase type II